MKHEWHPQTPEELHRQAERCQKLAACVFDRDLRARLQKQAAEFMAEAGLKAAKGGRRLELWIKQYKDGQVTEEHWVIYPLEHAKDIVCKRVREGAVDRVEIRTANNQLIFQYPLEVY